MSATNTTQNYHFPLFSADDKPSILTDWNGTVEELDRVLHDYDGRIESVTQTATGFSDQVTALRRELETMATRLTGDEDTIVEVQTALSTLREQVLTIGAKVKTHTTSINDLEDAVSALQQATSDIATIRSNASDAIEQSASANSLALGIRDGVASGITAKLFIPLNRVAYGEYVTGHRVNEDTHDDQPYEGRLYRCVNVDGHTGNWNSAHFVEVKDAFKVINQRQDFNSVNSVFPSGKKYFDSVTSQPTLSLSSAENNLLSLVPVTQNGFGNITAGGVRYNAFAVAKYDLSVPSDELSYLYRKFDVAYDPESSDLPHISSQSIVPSYAHVKLDKVLSMGTLGVYTPDGVFSGRYLEDLAVDDKYFVPDSLRIFVMLSGVTHLLESSLARPLSYGSLPLSGAISVVASYTDGVDTENSTFNGRFSTDFNIPTAIKRSGISIKVLYLDSLRLVCHGYASVPNSTPIQQPDDCFATVIVRFNQNVKEM